MRSSMKQDNVAINRIKRRMENGGPRNVQTAMDTGHLAWEMGLSEEAADRLQIQILTCYPERYRALNGATSFGLEQMR